MQQEFLSTSRKLSTDNFSFLPSSVPSSLPSSLYFFLEPSVLLGLVNSQLAKPNILDKETLVQNSSAMVVLPDLSS